MSDIQIPGPSMGLNELVDAFTYQNSEKRSDGDKWNPLRPSGAGKCEMELGHDYMEFKGHAKYNPDVKPPEVERLLNLGNKIEDHANWEMKAAFANSPKPIRMKYKQQTVSICRLHDNTLIEGNIDLWIECDEWRCMADWKSKSDKYSMFYKSAWDEFVEKCVATGHAVKFGDGSSVFITDLKGFLENNKDSFFNANIYQLNMYGCTDFAKERNITFCSIMQYNKNDSRLREIRFVPDDSVFKQRTGVFQRVAYTVDTTKSVEGLRKEYILGTQKCGFCRHRERCWPENDALKDYFRTLPPKQWAKDLNRLPQDAQDRLIYLFDEYKAYTEASSMKDKVEMEILKILDECKVYKVKLSKEQVYQVKRLKEGYVLRRSKE